jgi:phosphate transport system permease protein
MSMNHEQNLFPEGEALEGQIESRHRRGLVWRVLFQISTIVGIIALTALLYNIINQAFGLVAVQNVVEPEALVLEYEETRMLSAANTVTSEDDSLLAEGIAGDPNAIGFFGYAYYQLNRDRLRALSVEGVAPSAATAASGDYPLARPLFLYTAPSIMAENPQVAAFINYYLTHVNEVIEDVGYFPVDDETLQEAKAGWLEASGLPIDGPWPTVEPANYSGQISIAGSSTVFPLTQRVADMFQADGFEGEIVIESVGSSAGLRRFCLDADVDIANASREIRPQEYEACRAADRQPLEVRVGTDALAVVTASSNEFVEDVSLAELRELFTDATSWSNVNQAWPDTAVARYIPGADSGTLDFFSETVFPIDLADLPKDVLVSMLAANISSGVGRRLEREQRFYESALVFESPDKYVEVCSGEAPPEGCTLPPRAQEDVYRLVVERVVQPEVQATWSLVDSVFNQSDVLAQAQREYPNASIEFRSWLTSDFVSSPQSDDPELAGVRTALLGSLWVIAITILFSFPIGVGAAIYLEEYASDNRVNRFIQTNINNLAGVPSIIYGMLGLAIFVRLLETITSGAAFGIGDTTTTANGRTILSAGLTLGLLILPIIIINAQEAIRAVPSSLRQASYGLGATQWQTIWSHVLPNALPGILTGTILAMSRAIGETAPLVVVGASTFITVDPDGPFSKFTTLPIQIYQWTSRPQDEFRNIAAAAIIVLLVLLLTLNASAVILRNRFSKRLA